MRLLAFPPAPPSLRPGARLVIPAESFDRTQTRFSVKALTTKPATLPALSVPAYPERSTSGRWNKEQRALAGARAG